MVIMGSQPPEDFRPREYQVEMLETAIKRNTIVFMPTGSGKTYIAGMLIKHLSKDIQKPYSEGGKRTFFLVNTVALVSQQADSIAALLPLQISTYSGDMGVDFWDQLKWGSELEKNQVLVMTAQIFLNLLLHDYIKLNKVNLLILDECHHTMHNHAMNQIMRIYHNSLANDRPRILGLTATLLNANCKFDRIEAEIKTLETNMDSKVITASDEQLVQRYSTNPKEVVRTYSSLKSNIGEDLLNKYLMPLKSTMDYIKIEECPIDNPIIGAELLADSKKPIKKRLKNILQEIKVHYDELGLYAAAEVALAVIVRLERLKLSCSENVLPTVLEIFTTKLHHFRNRAFNLMGNYDNLPLIYATPKLMALFEILRNFRHDNVAIVFVERRLTAKVLYYIFNKLSKSHPDYAEVKPDFIVGFNNNPYNDTRETLFIKKSNVTTLRKFNYKETNVLFASNVIEEGIDIRLCNYVIKFDVPQTFRSYIQSKGRARHKDSSFILVMPEGSSSGTDNYRLFRRMEEYMKENLSGGKAVSYLENIDTIGDDNFDHLAYFVDGPNSAKVTVLSAIPLINRYCQSLPQDKFCPLTTYWWIKEFKKNINSKTEYVGILQLPVNSPIKQPIEGPPCDTKINAKRTVALEACKSLHRIGELDTYLIPCGSFSALLNDETLYPYWDHNVSRAGSKKIRRSYNKHYSDWECECRPKAGVDLYLHFIKITPNYEKPDKSRLAAFYEILKSKDSFAILTSKKWPQICMFTMFMNVGEVKIEVLVNSKTVKLTTKEIHLLFNFHCFLFTDILSITKMFVMRDYDDMENCYFIAPTIEGENGEIDIDWETVEKHSELPEITPLSNDSRKNIIVNEETYLGKVVVPWYRPKGYVMRYIVTKVCKDEVPDSPFPSANFESYAHYFQERYNQTLLNPTQPLIEVRAISSKLNCLLPRGKRRSSRRRNRHEEDDFEETLIPELCCLIEFPSVYMLKSTLLPSVLHRIHHLLIAEELRQKIARETTLGLINVPSDEFFSHKLSNEISTYSPPMKRRKTEVVNLDTSQGFVLEPVTVDHTALQYDDRPEARSTIEVSDLLTSNMNALKEGIFPWKEDDEPFDIERQLHDVDLLAVIHYQRFMSETVVAKRKPLFQPCTELNGLSLEDRSFISEPPFARLFVLNEANNKKNVGPQQSAVLQALTSVTAQDIMNYERLETLGDSFLKFIVSLALFTNFVDIDEGKLTQVKGKIIGNKNFFFIGRNINLGKLIKVHDFSPSDWDVPCFTLSRDYKNIIKYFKVSPTSVYQINLSALERDSGILREETRVQLHELIVQAQECDEVSQSWSIVGQQTVPDKTIADTVEALVGVYLEACGIKGAVILCRWLGILSADLSDVEKLLDFPAPTARLDLLRSVDFFLVEPGRLENTLGYHFKDKSFLLQALTHASFQNNVTDCYQRLEFLGDAILDFLITAHIYENGGNLSPGQLTDLRSALVNNVTFACLSVRYGFHKHLNARASKLNDVIVRFVKHQESRNHKIGAEVLFLIEEQNAKVAESIDVPKILGDVFEAIAAAVYLDSGKNLQQVWNVFYNLMKKEIDEFSKNVPKNPIRLLYEKFPSPPPKFGAPEVIPDDGRVLIPLEVIHCRKSSKFHGIGENKFHAKLAAAKMALRFFHERYQENTNNT